MNSEMNLRSRLEKLISDEKPFAWAKRIGINGATFNRIWNENGQLKSEHAGLIVKKTGVSGTWLLTGEGPMYAREAIETDAQEVKDRGGEYAAAHDDYVLIPVMQGKISAGGGLVPDNNIEMNCAFQRKWIARTGDPKNMSMIRIRGDSMAPTLLDGDMVLVNHGVNTVSASGGIYAITFGDEIMIKRVEKIFPSGQLEIRSDNPDYKSFVVDPIQVIINGKIIWYARSLER
jgi:phage repressor protein C with HTH and peptisase S24 domain